MENTCNIPMQEVCKLHEYNRIVVRSLILCVFTLTFCPSSIAQSEKGFREFLKDVFGKCNDLRTTCIIPTIFDCSRYQHGDWILIFSDEFDNNTLDTTKWFTCEDGWNRKHGDELQYYKDENIIISSGNAHLVVKEEPGYYDYWDFSNEGTSYLTSQYFQYTSGWIQTKTKFKYGLFEIRCKIPQGTGLWPAFWLFGEIPNNSDVPLYSEIDIFEFKGENTTNCLQNYHLWEDGNRLSCGSTAYSQHKPFSDDYHIYSLEWDEFRLVYRVDGNITRVVYRYVDTQGRIITECNNFRKFQQYFENQLFPTTSLHVILNLAISNGGYGNKPNESTPFPSSYDIDYVRIYRKSNPNYNLNITKPSNESYYTAGNILVSNEKDPIVLNNNSVLSLYASNEIVFEADVDIPFGATLDAQIIHPSNIAQSTNYDSYPNEILLEGTVVEENDTGSEYMSLFEITPNPTTGNASIVFLQNDKSPKQINIIDSQGRIVFQASVTDVQSCQLPSTLPNGQYKVSIVSPTMVDNKVLIIK